MRDESIKALFDALDADPRPEFLAALRRRIEREAIELPGRIAPGPFGPRDRPVLDLEVALHQQAPARPPVVRWAVAAGLTAAMILALVFIVRTKADVTPVDTPVTNPPTSTSTSTSTSISLAGADTVGARLRATIPVANTADSVVVADDAVWVSGWDGAVVSRIDVDTNEVISVDVGATGTRVTVGEGGVWVGVDSGQVLRLDPDNAQVIATIDVGPGTAEPVPGAGAVWVWTQGGDTVSRIDPQTNQVTTTVEVTVNGLVADDGGLWALTCDPVAGGGLVSIDSQTLTVSDPVELDDCANSIGFVDESVWVGLPGGRTARVDPTDRTVEAILDVGPEDDAEFLTTSDGAIWRPLTTSIMARIDTASNAVTEILDLGRSGQVAGFAVGHGSLWAGDYGHQTILRIDE